MLLNIFVLMSISDGSDRFNSVWCLFFLFFFFLMISGVRIFVDSESQHRKFYIVPGECVWFPCCFFFCSFSFLVFCIVCFDTQYIHNILFDIWVSVQIDSEALTLASAWAFRSFSLFLFDLFNYSSRGKLYFSLNHFGIGMVFIIKCV